MYAFERISVRSAACASLPPYPRYANSKLAIFFPWALDGHDSAVSTTHDDGASEQW